MILYLWGVLAEICGNRVLDISNPESTENLKKKLGEKYPSLDKILYRMSVNGEIINEKRILTEQDQVHLFPPFPGG